jgi:hypothetical protein
MKARPMKAKKQRPRARNERVSNPRQRRQQHLLDVKVRSHKATQQRNRRILVIVSKVVLAAAFAPASIWFQPQSVCSSRIRTIG